MTQILIHPSITNKNYSGITKALSDSDIYGSKIIVYNLHNECLDTISKFKPAIVVFPAHEYTQEIHAAIENYEGVYFFLILDSITIQSSSQIKELINYWSTKKNVKIIAQNNDLVNNSKILKYDHLYDDTIFNNLQLSRNNKTCIILSSNNSINEKIRHLVYPNSLDVLCFNNPSFDNPSNLGVLSYSDLNIIFNTFSKTIDLTDQFTTESQICGCDRIDIENTNTLPKLTNDMYDTYQNFITNNDTIKYVLGN